MDKIHDGIGDRLSVFFQWTTSFFAGVVIGFIYEWRLTLVLLGATPFMIASAAYFVRVSQLVMSVECEAARLIHDSCGLL